MFGTSQTNTLSTECQSLFSVSRCFSVSANVHCADFINPAHKCTEVTGHRCAYSRNFALNDLTFSTVQRYPIAFFNYNAAFCRHCFRFVVNSDVCRTRYARSTHTASNHSSVRSHTAASSNHTLRSVHTADIFRRSFVTDKDNFFTFSCPSFCIFGAEYGTTHSSTRRCRQTVSNNFFIGFRVQHWVQQLV